jgi:hypothetical protein
MSFVPLFGRCHLPSSFVAEMSKEVISVINHSYELATYSTPELRRLFADWLGEIEGEEKINMQASDN